MLIDESEKFLQRYEKLRQRILNVNGPSNPVKEWTGDCQKLHDLFSRQESRTKEQINGLLSKETSPKGHLRTGVFKRSSSQDIWSLFAKEGGDTVKESIEEVNEKSWNETAGRARSDVRRLMRHIEDG